MSTPYTAGTVTLTNGSTVITGIGTAWQTALIAGGILIAEADGNPLPILSVDSNTQITAAIKWKGASGTYPYAIMRDTAYGQQTVANAQALATYLTRLDTATLSALNALGPSMVADRVPYATSNAAMAWAPFTSYGRTLVAATSDATFASAAKVVRRSGGTNMTSTNDVMVGWHSTLGGLIGQVDAVYLGNIWTDYYASTMGGAADIRSRIGAFSTSGGVISGTTTINAGLVVTGGAYSANQEIAAVANQDAGMALHTGTPGPGNSSRRWGMYRNGYPNGEPGGNSGSDLLIMRHGDNGAWLGNPMQIQRRTGIVETRETPLCAGTPYGPIVALNTGQSYGLLRPDVGFDFNRGSPGFTAGGSPGVGGRAVHVPHTAWYFIRVRVTFQGTGGRSICVTRNGTPLMFAFHPGGDYCTEMMEMFYPLQANDWLALQCTNGPINVSLEHTYFTIQFIQF